MTNHKNDRATSRKKAPSMKVKKGDTVLVLSGKDKGAGDGSSPPTRRTRRSSSRASAG